MIHVITQYCYNLSKSRLLWIVRFTFVAGSRTIIRPSKDHASFTLWCFFAAHRRSWFVDVSASSMAMPVPFSFLRARRTALRTRYEQNFAMMARGLLFLGLASADPASFAIPPLGATRCERSMSTAVRLTPSRSLASWQMTSSVISVLNVGPLFKTKGK